MAVSNFSRNSISTGAPNVIEPRNVPLEISSSLCLEHTTSQIGQQMCEIMLGKVDDSSKKVPRLVNYDERGIFRDEMSLYHTYW